MSAARPRRDPARARRRRGDPVQGRGRRGDARSPVPSRGFAMTPYGQWHTRELELFVELLGMDDHDALLCMTRNAARATPAPRRRRRHVDARQVRRPARRRRRAGPRRAHARRPRRGCGPSSRAVSTVVGRAGRRPGAPVVRARPAHTATAPVPTGRRPDASGVSPAPPSLTTLLSLDGRDGHRHRRGPRASARRSPPASPRPAHASSSPIATSRAPRRRAARLEAAAVDAEAAEVDVADEALGDGAVRPRRSRRHPRQQRRGVLQRHGHRPRRRRVRPHPRGQRRAARSCARASSPGAAWPTDGAAAIVNVASVDALAAVVRGTGALHGVEARRRRSDEVAVGRARPARDPGQRRVPRGRDDGGSDRVRRGRRAARASTSHAQWAGIAERTPIGRLVEPDEVGLRRAVPGLRPRRPASPASSCLSTAGS